MKIYYLSDEPDNKNRLIFNVYIVREISLIIDRLY